LIISGEELSRLDQLELAILRSLIEDPDVQFHLIYFVRHQSECLVGLYQTYLTSQYYREKFDVFLDEHKSDFDFYKNISLWNQAFNFATISVEQYTEPSTGDPVDSVKAFAKLISKICANEIELPTLVSNQGVGGNDIQLYEYLRNYNDEGLVRAITRLSLWLPKEKRQIEFLTQSQFSFINQFFHELNLKLLDEFDVYPSNIVDLKKIELVDRKQSIEETIKGLLLTIAQELEESQDKP
jgi:hypothetical protein